MDAKRRDGLLRNPLRSIGREISPTWGKGLKCKKFFLCPGHHSFKGLAFIFLIDPCALCG